jgi:3-oxoacyl-[acyl-carrier-protein] synthase III
VFGWWTVGSGVLTASIVFVYALRLPQPAFDVARACAVVIAALLAAKVLAWVAVSGANFGREERLLAFVMLASAGLGWIGAGEWVDERAFDFRVAEQRADLSQALHDTSMRITQFCNSRDLVAPPRPRPATWEQDMDAFARFETETVRVYERRFGARVRAAHDLASLRGLRDRDLDAFFRHPANEFQMRVIAKKLDGFSSSLARR